MEKDKLLDLAERCEKAEPSQQRDLLDEAWHSHPRMGGIGWHAFQRMLDAEAYESAALTLVPEGWTHLIDSTTGKWIVELFSPLERVTPIERGCSTAPALALCAAALRARAADTPNPGDTHEN